MSLYLQYNGARRRRDRIRKRWIRNELTILFVIWLVGVIWYILASSPRPSISEPVATYSPYYRDSSTPPRVEIPIVSRGIESEPFYPEYPFDDVTLSQLAMQIAIEAEGGSLKHKQMVAQCILDRTETKSCSDGTVYGTLTRPGQFAYRADYHIEDDVYEAIDLVFRDGKRMTEKRCIWFCNPSKLPEKTRAWFYRHEVIYEADGNVFFSNDKVQ